MGYQSSSYACDRLSGITKTTSLLSCYTAAAGTFFSMDSHFELESLSTVISEKGFIGKDGWKFTDIIYIPPVSPSYLYISSIMFVAPLE